MAKTSPAWPRSTSRPRHPAPGTCDVGCGQGTQALRMAARGHRVTALDSSQEMPARLREADARPLRRGGAQLG
ncbi:class I SAM-dependent methyltransferase [Planotetraspora phitsanulokensis]|uniref:class I SAM-dependent methyltransferase n=1 Tax=Planotetraspora phitsanulokensis TaxID=575192 RepID=UPI0035716703